MPTAPLHARPLPRLVQAMILGALIGAGGTRHASAQSIPSRLADSTFWRMMTEYSEPWGTFRSENFVSNETSLQWVIPELTRTIKPGGVYLGVAPDQNFTYIVALKPSIAFIVDIRHQNAMQLLLYKALIEMSATRAEFLSKLYARYPSVHVDSAYSAFAVDRVFAGSRPDSALYRANLAAIKDRLTRVHRFALSDSELVSLDCVYGAFFTYGPELTYSHGSPCANPGAFGSGFGQRRGGRVFMPTYVSMLEETDGTGRNLSYLASETNFRALKDMVERNLIVPLTGNFAGDKALRSVGEWARDHGATITTFYVSNVEQYLFRQDAEAERFYRNVATLPIDSTSTFIRSSSYGFGGGFGEMPPGQFRQQSGRSLQLTASVRETLRRFAAGLLQTYFQVLQMSRQ